jgi:exonuclease III
LQALPTAPGGPVVSISLAGLLIWALELAPVTGSVTLRGTYFLFRLTSFLVIFLIFMLSKFSISCWNVCGLGRRRKRDDFRAAVESFLPSILCIQESKLDDISRFLASSFLPPTLRSLIFKPSNGASGGIVTAWNDQTFELLHHYIDDYSITSTFSLRSENLTFSLINVYGPCTHDLKAGFLLSLEQIFATLVGPVAIIRDFNLLRAPRDKSNDNFNLAEATIFNESINSMGLLEIPLLDRQFTWSNQQDPPILARLDRILVNPEWSFALPDTTLTSSARPISDHVPLHIIAATKAPRSNIFRMENTWLSHSSLPPIIENN